MSRLGRGPNDEERLEAGFDSGFDCAAAEVQAALHLTRRAAESDVTHACDLVAELPQV